MLPSKLAVIETAALQLSAAERSHLAERLLFSLEEDDEITNAWIAEATRRGESFERGEESAVDADDVISRLQAMISATPR